MPAPVPIPPLVPSREITGMSAVLLPFRVDHSVDWSAFEQHVERTLSAGLTPAVNMDTGYINLLDESTKAEVLRRTGQVCGGRAFVAGTYVADEQGDSFNESACLRRMNDIETAGGVPVIFQSWGLTQQSDEDIVRSYEAIAAGCDRFVGFELGEMFLPFGKVYSLEVYEQLMQLPSCIGAKHSSLRRDLEWQRLDLRNRVRPDFMVLTGNDLAIDMVIYGSDYLLGLSSFCPDLFARRDALWAAGDAAFFQLNDILQYLGFFAFRTPVPAYKHTCAQFLHLRQMVASDLTHPDGLQRPESDREILSAILDQLTAYIDSCDS